VGHIPGTAVPGENGNVAVAGHRDTLFRGLGAIRDNDVIQFETLEGSYAYTVQSIEIVKPRDVSVLKPGRYPELTLVTCYPFNYVGSAPDRFIVKARQILSSATRPVSAVDPATPIQAHPVSAPADPPKPAVAAIPGRVTFNLYR